MSDWNLNYATMKWVWLFVLLAGCYVECEVTFKPDQVLYAIESVWNQPENLDEVPCAFVRINPSLNSTEVLLRYTFPKQTFLVGSAFDEVHSIYYFTYTSGMPLKSYLAAIDVKTPKFLFTKQELEGIVMWDLGLDSKSNLHYLTRASLPSFGEDSVRVKTNLCLWDQSKNQSTLLIPSVASIAEFGSLQYDDSTDTVIVATSMGSPCLVHTISNYVTTTFPVWVTGVAIFWNRHTNQGYLLEGTVGTTESTLRVAEYVPLSSDFPEVCPIVRNSSYGAFKFSLTHKGSISKENLLALMFNKYQSEYVPPGEFYSFILFQDLTTCKESYMVLNSLHEPKTILRFGGLEFGS